MMASQPGAKMSNHTQTPAEIAQAALEGRWDKAEEFRPEQTHVEHLGRMVRRRMYQPTGSDQRRFEAFVADKELSANMRKRYSMSLFQPYRSVGKPNPARRRPAKAKQPSTAALRPSNDSILVQSQQRQLPSRPAPGRRRILTELAKTFSHSYLRRASVAIARIHTDAGNTPPSREPEVTSVLKHLKGTPRQLVTDTNYAKGRDRRIAQWTDWCRQHRFDPDRAQPPAQPPNTSYIS